MRFLLACAAIAIPSLGAAQGKRKLYRTLSDGESYVQRTFLTHPWLVTDEKDNAWYVYFPEGQPRTISIAPPR